MISVVNDKRNRADCSGKGVNRKGNKGDDNFRSKHSKPITANVREEYQTGWNTGKKQAE